ncbi:MAG: hypothetical protein JXR31_07255 [Prolixibacteraceae bacterium]|nr:hypothetical protein [Prolixibacteraceae bacterium]MBN2774030.1 hypothetical protein [Prolixibacteraceae bacterium]
MEEKEFKKLMEYSELKIEFPDFEDKVMENVNEAKVNKKSVSKNIRLAWFFFLIGLTLGLIATNFIENIKFDYFGEDSNLILLAVEVLIVLIITTQFDNLIRFTFKRKNRLE